MGIQLLNHVSGVHFLAVKIARQIKHTGLPIDLGRVSGAAAGHDIGKIWMCWRRKRKELPTIIITIPVNGLTDIRLFI